MVHGQRWMQTVSDVLLGWATVDGRPYQVRQFRDMKGSIDPSLLKAGQLDDYARVVGVVLARAHGQSIDPRLLHGYCDADGEGFDRAFARFAVRYADQTEDDHRALPGRPCARPPVAPILQLWPDPLLGRLRTAFAPDHNCKIGTTEGRACGTIWGICPICRRCGNALPAGPLSRRRAGIAVLVVAVLAAACLAAAGPPRAGRGAEDPDRGAGCGPTAAAGPLVGAVTDPRWTA